MASSVVTDPEGPRVVTRADGVECYRIDEWHRRFGNPGVSYGQVSNDA